MSERTIILPPGGGRAYEVGAMRGVFKHDSAAYCASEWSVEPRGAGPGPHHHDDNEEVFLVTDGTLWFLVGEEWVEAPRGTFLRIPAGVTHDFANRGDAPATAFNMFLPGGFEGPFREWYERRSIMD